MRCRYNAVNFLQNSQNTPHSSPVRAKYGVSFAGTNFDLCSASVTAVLCAISRYIGSRYYGTRPYFLIFTFHLSLAACRFTLSSKLFWTQHTQRASNVNVESVPMPWRLHAWDWDSWRVVWGWKPRLAVKQCHFFRWIRDPVWLDKHRERSYMGHQSDIYFGFLITVNTWYVYQKWINGIKIQATIYLYDVISHIQFLISLHSFWDKYIMVSLYL